MIKEVKLPVLTEFQARYIDDLKERYGRTLDQALIHWKNDWLEGRSADIYDPADLAIAILYGYEVKDDECEYCNSKDQSFSESKLISGRCPYQIKVDGEESYLDLKTPERGEFGIKIYFCPMCGRKLVEE